MTSFAAIDARLDEIAAMAQPSREVAEELLHMGEAILLSWLDANGRVPADGEREGFRLLSLHAQGAKGDPSFNACRETCRETVYRYNVAMTADDPVEMSRAVATMRRLVQHLSLFISGKCQSAQLGEFCCSSRSLRQADEETL